MLEVFDSLRLTAAVQVQNSNAQEFANTLRSMAKTSQVLDFNMHELANKLWAMATIGRVPSEVCDPLCQAAAARCRNSTRRTLPTRYEPWPRSAGSCPRSLMA